MGSRFIPDSDTEFANMARCFAAEIAKDPDRYTLSELDAELLTRKVKAFRDALAKSTMRGTRTPDAICAKDHRRKEAEEIVRRLGRVIRASDQISAPDKLRMNIKERATTQRKGKCPIYPPLMWFTGAIGEYGHNSVMHELRVAPGYSFRGEQHREGAVRMELFVDLVAPGEPVPSHPGEFLGGRPWYLGSFTKSPIRVAPPIPPVPMLVVYWVRWADSSCRVGPFSKTCQARWEGARLATRPTLGAMPEVRQLAADPKQITVVTQFRERYLEAVRVEQRMLEDARGAGESDGHEKVKQLPMPEEPDARAA